MHRRNRRNLKHNWDVRWPAPRPIILHDPEKAGPGMAWPELQQTVQAWRSWRETAARKREKELLKQARHGNRRAIRVLAAKYGIRFQTIIA